jgi:aspartate aminotransferase-like enzyme
VKLPGSVDEARARRQLLDRFGVHVTHLAPGTWRLGLLGADAHPDVAERVLAALGKVLSA